MKKAVYNVMIITIIAKLLGFGREILLSYNFGVSGISDAYLISQTIPGTIFQFVGTGLTTSFIPVYIKVKTQKGDKEANLLTNVILSAVIIFSTIVILCVFLFTEPIIKVFASGFTGQTLKYAILFTRIGILSLYFSSAIYVFGSYLQANGMFSIVSFTAIPNSIIIMVAIFLGGNWNILALPIGSLVAVLMQVFILWPFMKKNGYHFRFSIELKKSYVREVVLLTMPVIIGVSVNQINTLVDRTLASWIAVGGISALIYADSLIMFVQGIFSQSIITVYYPSITTLAKKQDKINLKALLNEALNCISFILIPVMFGYIILAQNIVRVLYGRGAFDEKAIFLTGTALSLYGIGILGYGIREILSRVFYAFSDTKTPMKNAIVGMLLNIIMNVILARHWGIGGLALSTSISSIITAILLYISVTKKIGKLFNCENIIEYVKMIFSAFLMGITIRISYKATQEHLGYFIGLIVTIFIGFITYMIMCMILKVAMYQKIHEIIFQKRK